MFWDREKKKKMKNFSHFLFANIFILQKYKRSTQFAIFLLLIMSLHQGIKGHPKQAQKKTKYDKVVTHLTNNNENRSLTNSHSTQVLYR